MNDGYNPENWDLLMQNAKEIFEYDKKIDVYQLKKISSRIRKEYGFIDDEEAFLDALFALEHALAYYAKMYGLKSKHLKTIVSITLFEFYGFLHDEKYNYEEVADDDIILIAKEIVFNLNPYINDEVMQRILDKEKKPDFDIHAKENHYRLLLHPMLCLEKINSSIDFWIKEYGSNGYIEYMQNFGIFDYEEDNEEFYMNHEFE